MLQNQKFLNNLTFIILIFSLVWLKEINFLFYDSTESPDFAEYFVYFDHFANSDFKTAREHSGNEIISSKKAVIKLLKTLKRGGNTALLTDLNVKPSRDAIPIKCFSKITSVTRLHVFLHQKTGLPIIPAISLPCSDGSYLMKILKPIELSSTSTEKQIAQKCWDVFIPFMSQFPEPWLWMYRHWRYLPQKEDNESYPFYAESSEKFELWLRENS